MRPSKKIIKIYCLYQQLTYLKEKKTRDLIIIKKYSMVPTRLVPNSNPTAAGAAYS